MSTTDYVPIAIAYAISAFALWWGTRRSSNRFVRRQWSKPKWILLRLLVLTLAVHAVFALFGFQSAIGYPFVALIALLMLVEPTGFLGIVASGIGRSIYEWIFWFPSRRQLFLRNRTTPERVYKHELIGAEAIVVNDLKPVGTVTVHGLHRAARSDFGFIRKGERVVIESVGDFEMRVRAVTSHRTNPPSA